MAPDRQEPQAPTEGPATEPGARGTPKGSGTPSGSGRPPRPAPGKSGGAPVVASPRRRAPARFSWLGIALLGGAVVVALVVTVGIFLPAIGALGTAGSGDPAALPARISVCGRDWTRDALERTFSRDEILARTDAEPIVVATGPSANCPPEVGTGGTAEGMATTVYVKVADDAFVAYDLVAGP